MSAGTALETAPLEAASNQQNPIAIAEAATDVEERRDLNDQPADQSEGRTVTAGELPIEQKETKATKVVEVDALTPALSQGEREQEAFSQGERNDEAQRLRQSRMLPPAIRECFAKVVEASADRDRDGKTRVPIDDAIRAIAEALPDFLQLDRSRTSQPRHPGGDAFFRGGGSELSDTEAEELARQQLARSGLLRGQRVRVGED